MEETMLRHECTFDNSLLSCPNCAGNVALHSWIEHDEEPYTGYFIRCPTCYLETKTERNILLLVQRWNREVNCNLT